MLEFNEGGSSIVYQNHPEGKFTGIVYGLKNLGPKTNAYGNTKDKFMVSIECIGGVGKDGQPIDHMMEPYEVENEDGSKETVVAPHACRLWFNKSIGHHSKRTGTAYPQMQRFREKCIDRPITDAEWYKYDFEKDSIGVRVRYKVTHAPREDGGVWVNVEIIERADDQSQGELTRETHVIYEAPPEEDDQATPTSPPKPGVKAPPKKPTLPQKADNSIVLKRVLKRLHDKKVLDADTFNEWNVWADLATDKDAIDAELRSFVATCKDADVDISDIISAKSTGGDDLPF